MMKMMHHALQGKATNLTTDITQLTEHLTTRVWDCLCNLESLSIMTMAMMLDPRFKTLGFHSISMASEVIRQLKSECVAVMRIPEPITTSNTSYIDIEPGTWAQTPESVPFQVCYMLLFVTLSASSVSCERMFSKADELVQKKRNRLGPNTVKKLLFSFPPTHTHTHTVHRKALPVSQAFLFSHGPPHSCSYFLHIVPHTCVCTWKYLFALQYSHIHNINILLIFLVKMKHIQPYLRT